MEAWKSELRSGTEQAHRAMGPDLKPRQTDSGDTGQPTPGDSQGGESPDTGGPPGDGGGGSEATDTSTVPVSSTSSTALPEEPPEGAIPSVMVFNDFDPIHWFSKNTAITISWEPANNSIETTRLSWSARSKSRGKEEEISATSFNGDQDFDYFKEISDSRKSVSLNLNQEWLKDYNAEIMWIQLDWQVSEDGQEGVTTSPFFGVVSSQEGYDSLNVTISMANEIVHSDEGTEALNTPSSTPSPNGIGGGSSLSTGAIVGIAIGGVAFVAIVGALAWFLLRRRRKSKAVRAGYTGTESEPAHGAGNYMADKDPNSHVTESPDTPNYSDDERRPHGGIRSAATGHSHSSQDRNIGFLVEEGMTEDEIRRLEEEERQLDADVERMRASRR